VTRVCEKCGSAFSDYPIIDGKRRHLHGRRQCLECLPFKPRHSPSFYHPRPLRMLVCQLCGGEFSAKQVIDGKLRSLYRRKFCRTCSPFGLTTPRSDRSEQGRVPMPIGENGGALCPTAVRNGGGLSVSSAWSKIRGGRCEDCGYDVSFAALEFHHRDSRTKESVWAASTGRGKGWSPNPRSAISCARTATDAGITMSERWRQEARKRERMSAWEVVQRLFNVVPDSLFEFHHGTLARRVSESREMA